MGSKVADVHIKNKVLYVVFEIRIISKQRINTGSIYFFFDGKYIVVREVKANIHIGFPKSPFHVIHGKSMLVCIVTL